MNYLSQIIKIVSRQKTKNIELIGNLKSNTLLNRLYSGIHDGTFKTDEDAARFLYNSEPFNRNYKKLKYTLEHRLINTIFFVGLNEPRYSEAAKANITCQRNWAAAQILIGLNARKAAVKIIEKNIRKALKYEITGMSLDMARTLYRHYSIHVPNNTKKKVYKTLVKKQKHILDVELKAEEYFVEIKSMFSRKRGGYSEELVQKADVHSRELKKIIGDLSSKNLTFYSHQIYVLRHELEMNYDKVVNACTEAIKAYKKSGNKTGITSMYLKLVISYISLKRFKEAKETLDNLNYPKGSTHWFIINELKLIYHFYNKEYQEAVEIQSEVGFHQKIKSLPVTHQEGWKLYAAYLHFFKEIDLVAFGKYENVFKKFRLTKFLNDIPEAYKDKEGLNIQILIIQAIFLLRRDKIDQAINRIQFLHQYCGKYLKKDHTYRSNVFIRMLIVLIRNQMHRAATIRKSAKYLKLLKEHPIEKSKQSIGIEVVPFEDLWELIIADTRNEFRFTPAKMRKVEAAFGSDKRTRTAKK